MTSAPFDEVRFPTGLSFSSAGGPMRLTQVVILGSGIEARNARWTNSRRKFNAGYGIKSYNDLALVNDFFEARDGRFIGFRFKWHLDFQSCPPLNAPTPLDQRIGTGDGATLTFQLVKAYTSGPRTYTRKIFKPVAGSVTVAVNGVPVAGWVVDTTTGIVTFGVAPAGAAVITAGFQYDIPVRFDIDDLSFALSDFKAGKIPSIPVIELLL